MAVERFLPYAERTRRAIGWVFACVGLLAFAVLVMVCFRLQSFTVATLVLMAALAAVAALGLYLALRLPVVLEVDLANRTYAVIRNGSRGASGPLDQMGSLAVTRRSRQVRTKNGHRTIVEFVVNPTAAHSSIDLFVMDTAGKARRSMEAIGRAWQLPCQSLGGEPRAPQDLDKPLHERVRVDGRLLAPMPLRPEWGLRVEPLSPGLALVSNHRSWVPLGLSALFLLPVPFVLLVWYNTGLGASLVDSGGALLVRTVAGVIAFIVLALFWKFLQGARDTFFPGTVRVTERGVSYRGRRMAFSQIEEVTAGLPIEIVGDRRILSLATSFCPPEATDAVAYELQRMILDVAPRGPLGI